MLVCMYVHSMGACMWKCMCSYVIPCKGVQTNRICPQTEHQNNTFMTVAPFCTSTPQSPGDTPEPHSYLPKSTMQTSHIACVHMHRGVLIEDLTRTQSPILNIDDPAESPTKGHTCMRQKGCRMPMLYHNHRNRRLNSTWARRTCRHWRIDTGQRLHKATINANEERGEESRFM